MAKLIRSAKLGNWTLNELDSYNIHLECQEALQFFGVPVLPDPAVDPELLQHLEADDMQQDRNVELIHWIELVMRRRSGDSTVVNFVLALLHITGYVHRDRVTCMRMDLPLLICGEWRHAESDVCIIDRSHQDNILLLVQEDKRLEDREPPDVYAQLVAEALAAFTKNNASRESSGLPPLESKVMPGIVMAGTVPTFFKIPVTQELVTHVRHGTYPPTRTVVTYCVPPLPRPARGDGMKPLNNRRQIFGCYEAFKTIVGI